MSAVTALTYEGEGFHPPTDSTFVHNGHEYELTLMHIYASNGVARSGMQASNSTSIVNFEFIKDLTTSEQEGDNVLRMHPPQKARA